MKLKVLVCLGLITLATSLKPEASAQTFSVIHTFAGAEGAFPRAGVAVRGGNLFGTAFAGGNNNFGTVYELVHAGSDWGTLPVYLFSAGTDGANPEARVVFGPDGHPYGTTYTAGNNGSGVVFDLSPPLTICRTVNCFWKENEIYGFQSGNDGSQPGYGDVTWDTAGNIYGTTIGGGSNNLGTIYELVRSGNSWTENVIYRFSGPPDGLEPQNGVMLDANGNIFGTTPYGGLYNFGIVFELTYSLGVGWTERHAYDFQNGNDGSLPVSGLIYDSSHTNLYGATSDGGIEGGGTLFELSPSGDNWTYKLLYSFAGTPGQQCGPWGTLTMDPAGNLYGTTYCDGTSNAGNVFKLTNTGNGWTYASLHDFTGGADGAYPISNVTMDANGNLYGTASQGGNNSCFSGCGVVWMIKP